MNTSVEQGRTIALGILRELPIIHSHKVGDTTLVTRVVGTFVPGEPRDVYAVGQLTRRADFLQDALSDPYNCPSTTFSPRSGVVSITHRETLLGIPQN